ncbi:TonB-dependent receptor [Chondrinema litorale]|uniref:TonB-dependent receptor n=1 Tax=Chondrinema litorale TaxID=2994555 RepID=UPI002542A9B8|nr:TonB-dependent receptor [Chondrinema litorale]UZR99698.1 TonB-dependent receptor [Chondrinema litorale]
MILRSMLLIAVLVGLQRYSYAQTITQQVRGQVVDQTSQAPLPFATVIILQTEPMLGATTDEDGNFVINNVPVGRYNLQASYMGYEPVIIPEVLVTKGKALSLTFKLVENAEMLDEIEVTPRIQKESAINPNAMVSARMLSVEEANRYAGGFDDPARLASSFAGVASNVANNAIVIRGNAPKFLQWKMEGVEIPNPNHFADLAAFGGGGLTALSSNLLANSDFLTGAFPAEYNNALSGVFDIQMRNGNNTDHEHSVQVGAIGIDLSSEGPLSKNKRSSYVVNYRYSTLGLIAPVLPEDAQGTNYQDLAFKLKFPTENAGVFSIWGIGLSDKSGAEPETDSEKWEYYQDKEDQKVNQYMGATGLNHKFFFGSNTSLNSTLAFSTNGIDLKTKRLNDLLEAQDHNLIDNKYYNVTFKSVLNNKVSDRHANKTGITVTGMGYDLLLQEADDAGELNTLVTDKGFSTLLSAYTNSTFFYNQFTVNAGINFQYFTLNQNRTIEPRLGISYEIDEKHKLSLGYGLHSRLERINTYFTKSSDGSSFPNKNLDFTKAHHIVLGYDWNINESLHLKIEPYYQYLFDIPVIADSTFSLLNLQDDWFISDTFVNNGKGRNYGIDFTLEQYMSRGFYFLFTTSLFQSEYKGDTDEWYNTRFNRNYLVNALVGKEYNVGRENQNLFSVNLRLSVQGGDKYSVIDKQQSALQQDVVYDETNPFTQQAKTSVVTHVTVNYKWNKQKSAHELSLKVINANNYKEFLGHRYNLKTQSVEMYREALIVPNVSYKISF